jgi:MoxR-like ATPase
VRTLADALHLTFSRIQFTPDLMPADIVGTNILVEDEHGHKKFQFQRGPIFAHVVLADEVNRATPKTQSALLEAMQERTVTVANTMHRLPAPFFVMATQNPIEMQGTYPLPEAQLDRFIFKLNVTMPSMAEMMEILDRNTQGVRPRVQKIASGDDIEIMQALVLEVPIATHVQEYALRIWEAANPATPAAAAAARRFVRYGPSPRGAISMVMGGKVRALLHGRYNVAFEDIRAVAPAALRHRLILNFEAEAEGIQPDGIIEQIIMTVPES